ncbi:MAG: class I SAM-dependent methyltransferase [Candidatus Sumerlaeota bacterium]|nr:class I SAM-dependent methyltransferase [Candidatus Sumerlaeota bacterium]
MPLSRDPSAADNPTAWHSTYFGPHYLALYATRLLKPMETGWEAEFVGTSLRLKVGALILDCPCGFGRHLRRLRRAGYRPIGVDLQVPYLRCAQQLTYEPPVASGVEPARSFVPVAAADMARLPFPPETFDALANLFTSFGYFPDDPGPGGDWPTNRGVLAEFARVLKRGGRLLIDVPNRDDLVEVIRRNPRTRMAGDDWEIREEWRYDTPTRRMDNKTHFRMQDDESDVGYNMLGAVWRRNTYASRKAKKRKNL